MVYIRQLLNYLLLAIIIVNYVAIVDSITLSNERNKNSPREKNDGNYNPLIQAREESPREKRPNYSESVNQVKKDNPSSISSETKLSEFGGRSPSSISSTDYIEDYIDAVTDYYSPADNGTIDDWTNMQATDSIYATLSEASGVGSMENTSWYSPSNFSNRGGSWGSVDNIYASDDNFADCYGSSNNHVDIHDFNLPDLTGLTILGIEMEIQGEKKAIGDGANVHVALMWNGRASSTTEKVFQFTTVHPDPTPYYSLGGSSDTWGRTWDGTDFTNTNFGVHIYTSSHSQELRFDHLQIKIYYTTDNERFDREFSFDDVPIDRNDYELCIKPGLISNEQLNVDIWNTTSTSWERIGEVIDSDDYTWKNISLSSYVSSTNFHFRFQDGITSGDLIQNFWQVDAALIKYQRDYIEKYVDAVTDYHSPADNGTIDDWTNMQATDSVYSTLAEALISAGTLDTGGYDPSAYEANSGWTNLEATYNDGGGTGYTSAAGTAVLFNFNLPDLSGKTITGIEVVVDGKPYGGGGYLNISLRWNARMSETVHQKIDIVGAQLYYYGGSSDTWGRTWTANDFTNTNFGVTIVGQGKVEIDYLQVKAYYSGEEYAFDREFSFDSVPLDKEAYELCVKTGLISTEQLNVDIWNTSTSSWNNIDAVNVTDDYTWKNISLSSYVSSTNFHFRFQDGITSGDSNQNTWQIDAILIRYKLPSTPFNDTTPPVINGFGVDDLGTGAGTFWAAISDTQSSVANATLRLNGTDYSMSYNGTNWIYQPSINYGDYFTYQIVNASDTAGNYITTPTSTENHTFTYDTVVPTVIDWEYLQDVGNFGTFNANVSDAWGEIDTVIVTVTNRGRITAIMRNTTSGFINDTLELNSGTIYFTVTVNDSYGNSYTSPEHQGYVPDKNHAPSVSDLTLTPELLYSNDTLTLNYSFSDPDGDSEGGTEIRWYKNDTLQPIHNDTKTISAMYLNKNDEWYATVRPKDGKDFGDLVQASPIIVQNSPPELTAYLISPSNPATGTDLECFYTYIDNDGDNENTTYREIFWYKNGSLQPTLNDSLTVSSLLTAKGDIWTFQIRVHDGTIYSGWYQAANITIINTIPTASGLNIENSSNLYTTNDLVANWTYNDVDDDEQVSYIIRWYKNGVPQPELNDVMVVNFGNTSKGQSWSFTLQVFDGVNYSAVYTLSSHAEILNSAPTVSEISITTTPQTEDILTASWNFTDADSDSESTSWQIRWYKDGILQPDLNDSTTVAASLTSKDDVWNYTLQVHDGTEYSILYTSPKTTILNTAPTVLPTVTSSRSNEDLIADWIFTDVDEDNQTAYRLRWYKDGDLQSALNDSTTVSASLTIRGEVWNYTLEVYDGETWSDISNSPQVTILNALPTIIGSATFTNTTPSASDDLTVNYTYFDNDEDGKGAPITYWFKNGQNMAGYGNYTTILSINTNEGEFWYYIIRVYDGFEYSNNYTSIGITIGSFTNSPPVAENLTLTATPYTTNDLVAGYDYHDTDGHLEAGTLIRWYKFGELQQDLNNSLIVPSSRTKKDDEWMFRVLPKDGLDFGSWENSTTVTIQNSLPEASELSLTSIAYTTTNLVATWSYFDADGDDEGAWIIRWYKNDTLQSSLNNSKTISSNQTAKDEVWYWTIQVYDGTNYSELYTSPSTTILNTAPTASGLNIENSTYLNTTDNLVANWTFIDVDDDTQISFYLHWYKFGELQPDLNNSLTVDTGDTTKGDLWKFTIQVYDGRNWSTVFFSSTVSIQNSVPGVDGALTIVTSTFAHGNSLELQYNYTDADDDIEEGTEIRWYKNGILQSNLNDLLVVDGSYIFKDDIWNVTVKVSDGSVWGIPISSASYKIGNTSPQVLNTIILNEGELYTTSTLFASFNTYDVDNDEIAQIQIVWYVDNEEVPNLENFTEVTPNNTLKDQVWIFEVRAFDGSNWSLVESPMAGVLIRNSKPSLTNITLEGGTSSFDNITVSYDFLDPDNDTESGTVIIWQVIRGGQPVSVPPGKILPSNFIIAGDLVYCIITPSDGADNGDVVITTISSSDVRIGIIIVGNMAPIILNAPKIVGTNGTTTLTARSSLFVNYTGYDPDSEDPVAPIYDIELIEENGFILVIGAEYQWYRNDELTQITTAFIDSKYLFKGHTWMVRMRIRDRYGDYSLWYNSSTIVIGNSKPEITSIEWNTNTPTTNDDLILSYDYYDYDDDIEGTTIIHWFINGTEIRDYENKTTLPHDYFTKGDRIFVILIPHDSYEYGASYNSTQFTSVIIIANSLPTVKNIKINNYDLVYTFNSLSLSYNYSDLDGDSELPSLLRVHWYIDGEYHAGYDNRTIILSEFTEKGQNWRAEIQVFDGNSYSIVYSSLTILVQNSKPIIVSLTINSGSFTAYADNELSLRIEEDDPDEDVIVDFVTYWYMNDIFQTYLSKNLTIPSGELNKGDTWYCVVSVYDGGLWSANYASHNITIINSSPSITNIGFILNHTNIAPTDDERDFLLDYEALNITYNFKDVDSSDLDYSLIYWYRNGILVGEYNQSKFIPASITSPGDEWHIYIEPYDGYNYGEPVSSEPISIQSTPIVHDYGPESQSYEEGAYVLWTNTTNQLRQITRVECTIEINGLNYTLPLQYANLNGTDNLWVYFLEILAVLDILGYDRTSFSELINTTIVVTIKVIVEIDEFDVWKTFMYSILIQDAAPPRVVSAGFEWNDDREPTKITFYAEVEDFGSNIADVILYYDIRPVNGEEEQRSRRAYPNIINIADDANFKSIPMTPLNASHYYVTIDYTPKEDVEVLIKIQTGDKRGNINYNAFPEGTNEEWVQNNRFKYKITVGLPIELLIGIVALVIIIAGISIRVFRKTVGLDIEKVLKHTKKISTNEIRAYMNDHTLGVVIATFDQLHGPIPIFVEPEILKDNLDSLVELSDRAFSAVRFVEDVSTERNTLFEFNVTPSLVINSLTYGYSLDRPEARGGAENISLNILLHKPYDVLISQFIDSFTDIVHDIHKLMDEHSSEREKIALKIIKLRELLTAIVLAYEKIYGSVEEFQIEE